MTTSDYSYTAIAAFVPSPFRETLAEFSRILGTECKSWYVLNETEFPPHITAWIAYIPTRNVENANAAAKISLNHIKPFEISLGKAKFEDGGYISMEIEVGKTLQSVHMSLLEHLNKFRDGYLAQKYIDTMHSFSPEQQESLKAYGTRAAGKLFSPHVTIGIVPTDSISLARNKVESVLERLTAKTFSVNELVFFRQGRPGKSIEIINHYSLEP